MELNILARYPGWIIVAFSISKNRACVELSNSKQTIEFDITPGVCCGCGSETELLLQLTQEKTVPAHVERVAEEIKLPC